MDKNLIKIFVDAGKGTMNKFSKEDGNKAVREALIELCGTDKPDHRTFRRHKNEIFEIVEVALDEIITSGWSGNPFFEQFVEYKSSNLGDKNEFTVPDNSILTVAKLARGNWDFKTQRLDEGTSFSTTVSTYGIGVGESLLRIIAGRMDWSKLVQKAQEGFENKIRDGIYSALKGSITYLPSAFKQTGSFTPTNLQAIVDHVRAANGNAPVVITGTTTGLSNVYSTPDISWSDTMKDEYNKTGKVAFWRGIPLLDIPQVHTANTFTFAIDDTQLYVIPANTKPIKIFEEGQAMIREDNDASTSIDMSVEYKMIKEYGIGCIFSNLYGMYDL